MRMTAQYEPLGNDESLSLDLERCKEETLDEKREGDEEDCEPHLKSLSDGEDVDEERVRGWSVSDSIRKATIGSR